MGRSKWSPQSNFKEIRKNKEKAKRRIEQKRKSEERRDYAYFKKHGRYRENDNVLSLKEEALYRYFCYIS
ncbi:MAG: hypothetical protein K6F27_09575 [Ruminococcus sp.]|nr:hypothetical protein [Ruminococcus sp.]